MASFQFTSAMLPEGTTLVFGSCVCVAAGAHRGADHRDCWANLKDLFININPLKRMATWTSTTRLDFTSRCNVDAP
jgi:hypothetical protein